ncbi:arginine--tRNA ligase [Helicobacter sp. 23-1045]
MQKQIKSVLDSAFAEFAGDSAEVILNVPKDSNLGHFTTPLAFSLAKSLKKSPNEIAKDLAQKLQNLPEFSRNFSKVEAVNGYVNLFLSDEFLAEFSRVVLKNGDLRGESISKKFIADTNKVDTHAKNAHTKHEHILLEFVSANPTGPLHIGHARGAIWGDTLARIGRFLGHKIITEYYINDAGSQIENLVNSVLNALNVPLDSQNLDAESTQNLYKGAYIVDLADSAKKHFGAQNLTKTQDLRDFCVKQMLDLIKANLQSANISFDNFVSEKSLMPKLDSTLARLKSNGALYEEGGKIWLKSTQYGDEKDRVIVRESGEPTYLAGDIVYHNDKFSRDFDRYINIWGADHHGYIARIKSSVAFLGYDSSKLEVLLSQMVSLLKDGAPYKMSKRAGTFILMSKIIDEIGIDALRFVFLTKRADTHLEFDITSLKAQDSSNPIFYINYANARIHTLLGKRDLGDSADLSESSDFDFANLEREWVDLLFFALLLPRILEVAFDERAMQKLPEYLKNLASKLHFCYNSFKIIGSENERVICNILKVVSLSITTGLGLMGITAKTKM